MNDCHPCVPHWMAVVHVVHHNRPQYFGYIGDNPAVASNLHGLADFFADIAAKRRSRRL